MEAFYASTFILSNALVNSVVYLHVGNKDIKAFVDWRTRVYLHIMSDLVLYSCQAIIEARETTTKKKC